VVNGGGGFASYDAAGNKASPLFLFASENGEIIGRDCACGPYLNDISAWTEARQDGQPDSPKNF
jgi:hypothetical protein